MFLEAALCALLLLIALVPAVRFLSFNRSVLLFVAVGTILLVVSASFTATDRVRLVKREALLRQSVPRSENPGYVRSDRCLACHPSEYTTWHDSFHRTMTQVASPETVLGKFDGRELSLNGEKYVVGRDDRDYWVEMTDLLWKTQHHGQIPANAPRAKYPVRMLTGAHHMQACWLAVGPGNLQLLSPFAWLNEEQRWVPFHQTFLRDPAMPVNPQTWNSTCVNCHATGPVPRRQPGHGGFDTRVGDLGISCEACHGPAEEHIKAQQNPRVRYAAHRANAATNARPDDVIVNPANLSAKRSAQICGQCHGIHWISNAKAYNENGTPFRPGKDLAPEIDIVQPAEAHNQVWAQALRTTPRFAEDRYWSDGMVRVSGREFNGLALSSCYKKGDLTCISCHSLHRSKPDDQLAQKMEGNAACLQCHTELKEKLANHTHHPAGSSGSLCYNCHMPYTTYGLLKGTRSHQIGSPNAAVTQKTGRPNACNLCHLDKPLGWTADYLATWYGQSAPPLSTEEKTRSATVLHALKGDAGQRALAAYAMGWRDAQKTSGSDWLAPYLAHLLDDPYSAVRYIASRSLRTQSSTFKDLKFDFTESPAQRGTVASGLLETWKRSDLKANEATLMTTGGIDQRTFNELGAQRDNKSIDLQE
jgi:predicted CXXCH cytochrome family protein